MVPQQVQLRLRLIMLVPEPKWLYSLQHKDYDNNFGTYSCSKEVTEEVHVKTNILFINNSNFQLSLFLLLLLVARSFPNT
jgi:hypothetical protein